MCFSSDRPLLKVNEERISQILYVVVISFIFSGTFFIIYIYSVKIKLNISILLSYAIVILSHNIIFLLFLLIRSIETLHNKRTLTKLFYIHWLFIVQSIHCGENKISGGFRVTNVHHATK